MKAEEIRNLLSGHATRATKMRTVDDVEAMKIGNNIVIASVLGEIAAQLSELNDNLKMLFAKDEISNIHTSDGEGLS